MSLIEAARRGDLLEVQRLVDQGAPVPGHTQNDRALVDAAYYEYLPVVEFLIDRGADVHAQNDRALINAAWNGHLPMVKFLLSRGADIHAQNDQALIYGVWNHNLPIVEYLLSQGANINVLSSEQREQYQHLVPQIISVPEYYQLELSIERIREIAERYIISTKKETYTLLK